MKNLGVLNVVSLQTDQSGNDASGMIGGYWILQWPAYVYGIFTYMNDWMVDLM